jgi:dihydroorotase
MKIITLSLKPCKKLAWFSISTGKFRQIRLRYVLSEEAAMCYRLNFKNTHILNAEPKFLYHLHQLHNAFPSLRIVLEHATTRAAVEAVKACGETVACTITAHHLALTVDDWAGQSHYFCKPVAKFPDDRLALREVIIEGKMNLFECF